MNRRYQAFKLILLLFFVLLPLTGCGAKLNTEMSINSSFSGTRTMTMEVKTADFEKIDGGSVAVERLIRENCPKEITAEGPRLNDDGNSEYIFTISFSSQDDYIQKIRTILGREPVVQFSRPENILASGFRVSEDFTSDALMRWLREAISREGLANGGTVESLWSIGETVLCYEGQPYPTGQTIQVDRIEAHTVSKITISTVVDEHISREIVMNFPDTTVQSLGTALYDHFNARIPDGAVAQWEEKSGAATLRIQYTAQTTEELEGLSRQLFSNAGQKVDYGQDREASTPLRDQRAFTETLDLSGLSSGGADGVKLEYRYENKNSDQLEGGYFYSGGEWKKEGQQDGTVYTYTGTTALLNIKVLTVRQYYILGGEIRTTRLDNENFERRITLRYDANSQGGAADYACTYYEERLGADQENAAFSVESADDQEKSVLTLTGSDSEISAYMGGLFGTGTFFTYARNQGALNFRYSSTFTDRIDWEEMLVGDSGNASINYVLDMGQWETVQELHCMVKDEKGGTESQQDHFPDAETGLVSFTLPPGRLEITAVGDAPNWTGVAIIGGIVICILLILIVMILLILNSDKPGGGSDDTGLRRIAEDEKRKLALQEAEEKALANL